MTHEPADPDDARRKRMHLRAWRRGTKEMDLILGRYADARLTAMDEAALAAFDSLLSEDDHDIFAWILGRVPAPRAHAGLLAEIKAFVAADGVARPDSPA
jgi:antitoxin CptB